MSTLMHSSCKNKTPRKETTFYNLLRRGLLYEVLSIFYIARSVRTFFYANSVLLKTHATDCSSPIHEFRFDEFFRGDFSKAFNGLYLRDALLLE